MDKKRKNKDIKRKIKIYDNNVNTNFHGKKIPKENASYKCFSLIMLDSVVKVKKKYYPQTLLEECKYEIKKTKMQSFINDELEASSSDDESDIDSDDTDNEPSNETDDESDNE